MNVIVLDFESFYDKTYSLSKLTTEEYIRDDQFEVIGIAVKENNNETTWYTGSHEEIRASLLRYDWANSFLVAHNALFDGAILSWRFDIRPMVVLDTLSMARAIHGTEVGGSLAKLVEYYQLGEKGTEVLNAIGKRRNAFTDSELAAYSSYCVNDVELTHKLFYKLLPLFSKTELKLIDITMRMFTDPVLRLDTPLLEAHLEDVKNRKEALLRAVQQEREVLMSNQKFAELLRRCGVEPPTKISLTTGKETLAMAKSDEGFKALAEHPDERVQALVAARLGTKSTLEETRTERFIGISKRGTLPIPLKYYGAKTGRWAAEGSINMQNVPRGSLLKKAIMAPEGYVMVGADLSNIELRVGLWLAGQWDKLGLLKEGLDLYKDFASSVFNVPYDEVTKEQRFIGKTAQLSLIYGTGAKKLQASIKMLSGEDIGFDTANNIVNLYRTEYALVKNIWNEGSHALTAVYEDSGYTFGPDGFFSVGGKHGILLSSGLYLAYPDLRRTVTENGTEWDYAIRRGRDRIYGAKVFQGLTQATARCIMAEHMLVIAKRYKIVLTVHDAVYFIAPEDKGQEAVDFVLGTMRTPPKWMPTIPLDAEAGYGKTLADC